MLYGMCNEIEQVVRLITQDQCFLVQTGVFKVILNLPPLQLPSNLLLPISEVSKMRDQL